MCVFLKHTVVKCSEHVIAHVCDTRYTEQLTQEYTKLTISELMDMLQIVPT